MAADAAVSAGVVACGSCHPLHRVALAGPGDQPGHQRDHRLGHLGVAARFHQSRARRRAPGHRHGGGEALPRNAAQHRCRPRSAHLGFEHDEHGADRASGQTRRGNRPTACSPASARNCAKNSASRTRPFSWSAATPRILADSRRTTSSDEWRGRNIDERSFAKSLLKKRVGRLGFEPRTMCLKGTCSTIELPTLSSREYALRRAIDIA